MVAWKDVESAEPAFAAQVRGLFDRGKHKTMATLRADGSPRISGIEAEFVDGEMTFGSMPSSRKGADLARDPRVAIHSPSVDPPEDAKEWVGEAKIAGRAVLAGDPHDPNGQSFRVDIDEVVLTSLNEAGDRLRVQYWRPGHGLQRVERE
jgi:hypothetical protein